MKLRQLLSYALFLFALFLNTSLSTPGLTSQEKSNQSKISAAEDKALRAVAAAPDINAKFAAAEEFLKKFPKSTSRQQVAEYLVDQILGVTEPNQQLALAQRFSTVFTGGTEANAVKPVLIDAFLRLNRPDEAFSTGASHLANNPDDMRVLSVLAIAGTEQAKKGNSKYLAVSRQYGAKAIELFESDKKPANVSDTFWAKQKTLLPQLYQEMAVISLLEHKPAEAQTNLEKAAKLNPADPFTYVLLGSIANEEYQKLALAYKTMPNGKEKDDLLPKVTVLLDKVIDQYAHAVGLAEGKPQYQQLHDQMLQDLESYYKYRHNDSTEGLQKLIAGYKLP
jgi:hypothetical protein